jgi:hypothetical protein
LISLRMVTCALVVKNAIKLIVKSNCCFIMFVLS